MAKTDLTITIKATGDVPEGSITRAIRNLLDYEFTPVSLKRDAEKHTATLTIETSSPGDEI
ncbi:hypothetical protein D1114_07175 [Cereibacter sphaeroides]|uniref:Uncharacterized protein n=1 Tax=Cereibacter sphaeroides TaxID=1063 RepID=A0AAX1UMU4_CERSP|nr:hypothetical protein [Cereibacter sphaeroides]RHZ96483.1 hypothetical protein D1114_07175 [Cereibacter sphaeroides]